MERLQPSNELRASIISSIAKEEYRRARLYLCISFCVAVVSIIGIVLSIRYGIKAINESSFFEYFSLIFSDGDVVRMYFEEFILSLIESLPVFAILFILSTIASFFVSIRSFINNLDRTSRPSLRV